jgi:hypothetical protein
MPPLRGEWVENYTPLLSKPQYLRMPNLFF